MRVTGFVLIAAALLAGVEGEFCFGKSRKVLTITIREAHGHLTVSPSFISIASTVKPETLKWVSAGSKVDFRIEFLYANPCDPHTSHLDGTPALCTVLPNHKGTYAYQIVSKSSERPWKSPVSLARVGSCGACSVTSTRKVVGVGCDSNNVAQPAPQDQTVKRGSTVTWNGLGPENPSWTVTFENKSPCRRKSLDSKNSSCTVTASDGEYGYTIKLNGCVNPGKGDLTVK